MHILLTTDTVGGVWSYARELAHGLVRRGHRVTVARIGQDEAPVWRQALPAGVESAEGHFPLEWVEGAEQCELAAREWMRKLVERLQPDLLHANQFIFAAEAVPVPVVLAVHSDVVSWWRAVHGRRPPAGEHMRWYTDLVRRALAAADAVVTPSRTARADLEASFAVQRGVRVIPNGRTPDGFQPQAKAGYAIAIGRVWDEAKQLALLERADLPLEVLVVGSHQHPQLGPRPVPAAPRLRWRGEAGEAEIRRWLARARILIATSRYEPFGLAPLEGAFAGCALLLNDIPSLREVWGEAALYFRANEGAALVEGLRRLAGDEALCRELAAAAGRRARALYRAETMVESYLRLYCRLVAADVPAGGEGTRVEVA